MKLPTQFGAAISARPNRPQSGFSLIEVLIGVSILAIALLGHTSASWSASRLATYERSRSEGMRFCQQFVERLRAEDDWDDLHRRLLTLEKTGGVPNLLTLNNGRRARPVTDYFADFTDPPPADRVAVLVDVPGTWTGGLPVLREDEVAAAFGLPADLSGDGLVDTANHASDCVALPIVIFFQYRLQGDQTYELRIATWLRGNR